MLPSTATRVANNTAPEINARIMEKTAANVARYGSTASSIDQRLVQLDQEWDTERFLECNASAIAFIGVLLGMIVHWAWLFLPLFVMAFLLLHALQGWCPPVPLIRRLGFRTAREIDDERMALKVLRGDFAGLSGAEGEYKPKVDEVLKAVQH
jgi:hypothetical protein